MTPPLYACSRLLVWGLILGFPLVTIAQSFSPQGMEYLISGALLGDQTMPQVAVSPTGGFLVWQDNAIDGKGLGVAAQRLDQNFSAWFAPLRVNQTTAAGQERPQVTLLKNGWAAVVWQGGAIGAQSIYMRLLVPGSTSVKFTTTNDVRINGNTNSQQSTPVIAALADGNLAVAWSSLHQDGSLQGIYARVVKTNATFVTNVFRANQFTENNQRNPAIAALTNGNFVVVWASENQGVDSGELLKGTNRVHIYGRLFNKLGRAQGDEFRINTQSNICANPAVCAASDGGFTVAWSQRDGARTNGWDVYARSFSADGSSANDAMRLNTFTYGDQFAPKLSRLGADQLVVWTSLGQDGSMEGVFGRVLTHGVVSGAEFRVNTTTRSKQIHPTVASDGGSRFLAVWSSYVGDTGFDILAQRYTGGGGPPLPQPEAPVVAALSQSRLSVTWPELSGFPLQYYEIYTDGSATPVMVTSNCWVAGGFAPNSEHSFELAYVMDGGQRSPKSPPGSGQTWGEDLTGPAGVPDGLPDDWQRRYWGDKAGDWPPPNVDSDGDGASNWQEFLAGTNPIDPHSVLLARFVHSLQGRRLEWNTVPGFIYQVQATTNFATWDNYGVPRFAPGAVDSVPVSGNSGAAFYRVIRLR